MELLTLVCELPVLIGERLESLHNLEPNHNPPDLKGLINFMHMSHIHNEWVKWGRIKCGLY